MLKLTLLSKRTPLKIYFLAITVPLSCPHTEPVPPLPSYLPRFPSLFRFNGAHLTPNTLELNKHFFHHLCHYTPPLPTFSASNLFAPQCFQFPQTHTIFSHPYATRAHARPINPTPSFDTSVLYTQTSFHKKSAYVIPCLHFWQPCPVYAPPPPNIFTYTVQYFCVNAWSHTASHLRPTFHVIIVQSSSGNLGVTNDRSSGTQCLEYWSHLEVWYYHFLRISLRQTNAVVNRPLIISQTATWTHPTNFIPSPVTLRTVHMRPKILDKGCSKENRAWKGIVDNTDKHSCLYSIKCIRYQAGAR